MDLYEAIGTRRSVRKFRSEAIPKEKILKILRRRPLSVKDLSQGMGIPPNELVKHLDPLIQEGKIQGRSFGDSIYYEISNHF